MEPKNAKKNPPATPESQPLPGYPIYPESDDALSDAHKKDVIPLEDDMDTLQPGQKSVDTSEKPKNLDSDLDIPGSELDDADEVLGEEDEENNYYSLGGERHENLEEDHED